MDNINFGYKKVPYEEKTGMVKEVFNQVAPYYDIMNDVMSFGLHRIWKNIFVNKIKAARSSNLLDVAGGTGDIAFRFLKSYKDVKVTICDINNEMLNAGKQKSIDENLFFNNKNHQVDWLCANAEDLPVADNSYDYYTIAFGIRNVTNISKALKEAYRVLKPGGRFLCLEFSHVDNIILQKLYDFYSFKVIPKLGEIIAKDSDSYNYLVESIRLFPEQENFKKMIEASGFEEVTYENMNGGVVAIHSGWKI